MCSIRDCGRYCASTITSKMPELTQFDNGKSIMRYLPAKGTAGFVRFAVSAPSREPSPPARMTARVFIYCPSLREVRDYLRYERLEFHPLASYTIRNISGPSWATRNPAPYLPFASFASAIDRETISRHDAAHR